MASTVDREYFAENFPSKAVAGSKLTASRKEGFDAIIDVWDERQADEPTEWLAYVLATAWHETGGRMQPVREGFATTDAGAYKAVTAYCKANGKANYAARHANGHSYYGRGYVQLTHGDNYKKMGESLGVGTAFYDDPDSVLDPAVGGKILIVGLTEGLFRPEFGTLADFFDGTKARWFDARDLVNGDKNKQPKWAGGKKIGTLIADYGKGFHAALRYAA